MKIFTRMLPTKEEVTELRNYVRSNISKFNTDNQNFAQEFQIHKEIIRRYDEVLIDKASKHSVYEVEKKCNDGSSDYFDRAKKMIKDL